MLHQITIKSSESDDLHIIKLAYNQLSILNAIFLQMAPCMQPYQGQRFEASDQPSNITYTFSSVFLCCSVLTYLLPLDPWDCIFRLRELWVILLFSQLLLLAGRPSEGEKFLIAWGKRLWSFSLSCTGSYRHWRLFTRLPMPYGGVLVTIKSKEENQLMFKLEKTLMQLSNPYPTVNR